jgi:large subunit ribosomal protein L5
MPENGTAKDKAKEKGKDKDKGKDKGTDKKKSKGGKGEAPAQAAAAAPKKPAEPAPPARLRLRYLSEIVPKLMSEFSYTNKMQVPRLQKIVLNMGLGESITNPKIIDTGVEQMSVIAGQKPLVTKSKKAIANFKLRANLPIGCMVTLRGERMYEFFDRLVNVALPRVRDFKGVPTKSFDGGGNYTLGVKEQIIFPEIDYDKVEKVKGLNVSFATTAKTDAEAKALLRHLGMPFRS